jgi:hypothetical protein
MSTKQKKDGSKEQEEKKNNSNKDLGSKDKNNEEEKDEEDILSLLPRKNLSIIEKLFPKDEGGLSLDEFVRTLLENLDYD